MTEDRCDLICIDAPRAEAIRARLLGEEAARGVAQGRQDGHVLPHGDGASLLSAVLGDTTAEVGV